MQLDNFIRINRWLV